MGLRDQARDDLRAILTDTDGFGWPITVYPPDSGPVWLTGFSNDVAQTIDPDTGIAVAGRVASVALPLSYLPCVPAGVADQTAKPWVIEFDDIGGTCHRFKVRESFPDRAIGIVTCVLETYV